MRTFQQRLQDGDQQRDRGGVAHPEHCAGQRDCQDKEGQQVDKEQQNFNRSDLLASSQLEFLRALDSRAVKPLLQFGLTQQANHKKYKCYCQNAAVHKRNSIREPQWQKNIALVSVGHTNILGVN
jgi:hypothetical protein